MTNQLNCLPWLGIKLQALIRLNHSVMPVTILLSMLCNVQENYLYWQNNRKTSFTCYVAQSYLKLSYEIFCIIQCIISEGLISDRNDTTLRFGDTIM